MQDAKSQSFKYVNGGPVSTIGRDYSNAELSNMIYDKEKYFVSGPQFNGTADVGKSTNGIGALKGNATPQTTIIAQNINGVGGFFDKNGLGGMIKNWLGYSEASALGDERELRTGFYNVTNAVDIINKRKGFNGNFLSANERTDMINFMTDGYLPVQAYRQYGNELGKDAKLKTLGGFLNTANMGVQVLGALGILRKETINLVNGLLDEYKSLGGDKNNYSGMSPYLKTETK